MRHETGATNGTQSHVNIMDIMKECILSDEAVQFIKSNLETQMIRGLDGSSDVPQLPMKVTFVTDQYKRAAADIKKTGQFLSICAHSKHFTLTLTKLNQDSPPEICKKDYNIDVESFENSYVKVYEAFANCIKNFFIELCIDGKLIPASFCTNLPMEQFSLDTAVIPYFTPESKVPHCKRDIKNFFENILMRDEFQDQTDLVKTSLGKEVGKATSAKSTPSDLERSYHATYDAKLLGNESIKRLELESTVNFCHEFLSKLQKSSYDMEKPVQTISLDVSHAGVKIYDKIFKDCLHHHPIHKISHVILDFKNARNFGYLYGDFLNGHQFFAFETDRSATEIVSLLRNIFEVELVRKKKEKLEMQASQVFLSLKNFLSLAHELKFRETEIPVLLKRRMDMVKDINWWLEGSVDECSVVFEEPEEQLLHVSLQNLYSAACQLKLIEIQKEAAAQKERDRLAGKRHRRKEKVTKEKSTIEELPEKESYGSLLIKASDILAEDISYWQSILLKERYEQLKKDEISVNFNHENLNHIRDFCFSVFNAWNQEMKFLNDKIESLIALENSERGKIKQEVTSIYTGKKQSLRVTKKLKKVNLFEDTDFQVPKRREKTDCELLNNIFSCEEYFLHALKIRREETEDLNYFISKLHYRPNIHDPEDSTILHYCRRLLIKAVKRKLKEIQDIEDNLEELKKTKEKIYYLIPDIIKYSADRFKNFINKQRAILECVRSQLSDFDVDLKVSEEAMEMCYKIYDDLIELRKMHIKNIEKEVAEIQEAEKSVKNIANICFLLYSQAAKMRKKEFHSIIADLDLLDSIEADCFTVEDKQLLMQCQEDYMTAASMREKEMEALKFKMKTADKKLKIEDSDSKATLKHLFYAAVELEKNECEKILSNENEFSNNSQVLPVVFTFKDFYENIALDLKQLKSGVLSFKDFQVNTLREFLLSAFEFKQKEIEIPMPSLKKDLENVLRRLIEDVKRRHHQKFKKREIYEQALKISRSWKEVFLLAINIRQKETEKIISIKRKEIEEQAIFKLMQDDINGKSNNMANNVVKIWKKIFLDVIDMKAAEMQKVNEILKKSPGDQKAVYISKLPENSNHDVDYSNAIGRKEGSFKENYMSELKTESTDVDDVDEEYYEIDSSNTDGKEGPFEELMTAIETCFQIYDVAINNGQAQLDVIELEIQPVFSDEFAEEKDLQADEICSAINKSSSLITKFIDNIQTEMTQIESNIGSLTHIKENIKSQASSAKSTSNHFLRSLLELEEKALKMTEENIKELDKNFEKLLLDDSEKLCPFTDLLVDVMSDDGSMQSESDEPKKKEELVLQEVDGSNNIMDKKEIQSFLLKIDAELHTGSDKEIQHINKVIDAYESCKNELEFVSEMQRSCINSIIEEIENLKLPDPKKLKTKEKNLRASKCITDCMKILSKSFSYRYSAIKVFQSNIEKMNAAQPKEQVMIEYESSDIAGRCQNLFLLIKETRNRNLTHMKSEKEKLESKTQNLPDHIDAEAVSYMKSEVYTSCRDCLLKSIDIKMQEIEDISSEIEFLNNVELKIKKQLKQLSVEINKVAITKLEKANDAIAVCKKVCISACERTKEEVKDSDELQLLKGVLQSSELGDGGNASKNLNFVDEMHEEKSQAAEKPMIDEIVELKRTEHVDMKKDSKAFPSWLDRFLAFLDFEDDSSSLITDFNQSSGLTTILEDSQLSGSFLIKSNDTDSHLQEMENYKNLLKSLEKKREKQAIYTVSSWDDLFLRSFLQNQIEKSNLENETHSYDISKVIMKERSWEDLFYEADSLVRKQEILAAKLKETVQSSISISSWTDVLVEAVNEWNVIIEKEIQHLQEENLLLQWRGSTKSKKDAHILKITHPLIFQIVTSTFAHLFNSLLARKQISNYSSGSQYGYKSTNFHDYIKEFENQNEFSKETLTTLNNNLPSWNNVFEKLVELIMEDRKAMNFMQKKNTKLQSQIINVTSSWDELFSNAIMQRKNDLQEEIKESKELKSLANKVVNKEVQGAEQASVIKSQKYDSWQKFICETSEEHRAEILDAIKAKKSEIEKSSLKRTVFERESADNLFLTLKPETLIEQGRKLMADALEIKKNEIEAMENELKKLSAINRENHHSNKIPLPVVLWKLILSIALSFKKSGLKYEVKKEKHFKINSKDLIKAALHSKLKESEDFESYWEKYDDKLIFMQITPANISWSKFLESTSELAKTDIGKMSMLGIKSKEKLESEVKVDDDLDVNLEAIEDSACWMDLVIEAIELKDSKDVSTNDLECTISDTSTEKPLISWDEVFYLMNLMCKNTIMNFFIEKKVWDHIKMKDIKNMVLSNFFTWDDLIVGVIEEVLWTFQELSESFDDAHNEESDTVSLFHEYLGENSLKDILKKLHVKSFIDLLPSKKYAKKLELEDSVNKERKNVLFPVAECERIKFNEETIWKALFPIAVEVWMKNMETYLDFKSLYCRKDSSLNNSLTKVCFEHTANETFSPLELHNSNLSSLQNLEKVIAYEYLSDIEPSSFENFSYLDQSKNQSLISKFPPDVVANMKKKFKDGENIDPEYFNVMCTWREMFKAALQRNKQFLKEIMDFEDTEEYSIIQNTASETYNVPKTEDSKSFIENKTTGMPDVSKKKNLKFNVFNVINQEITLTDLFEVIDSLKKKNLIILKELKSKEMMVEDTSAITLENVEVSNVIDSFFEFFLKAYQFRCYEKKMLEEEIGQLMIVTLNNCHKYKAHPVLSKLKFYFNVAVKKRCQENETINFILEHLNKYKSIFYGYLECPVTESLIQRNDKRIKEINTSLTDIEEQQNALTQTFRNCYNSLMSALDGYLKRRESEVELVEVEQINQLTDNLEVDHRKILSKLQKLFLSIMEFRKKEIINMKKQLYHWKRLNDREESIENIIHEIISSILKHFENELIKREKAVSLMSEEKNAYQRNKIDLKNKISSTTSYCKDFLLSAIENRNKEILFIESDFQFVKSLSEQPNKKTGEVINWYEKLCDDFVTMRKAEIKKLEKIFSEFNGVEIPKMQSVCIEYISQAVLKRKNELAVLTEVIESLDVFEEVAGSEISETFEEALADVIDFSSGMTFLHAVSRKKDEMKDKCDIKVLKKCFDFYVKRNEDVQLEIRVLDENAESLKYFKGGSILKLINVFEDFETLLDKRLYSIELDCKSIISEQIFVKKLQTSFISEIYGCLTRSKNHFQDCLNDTEHDLYVLKLKLNILNEDSQDKFEKVLDPSFPVLDDFNTGITDDDKTEISLQTTLRKDDIQYSEESFFVKESYETLNSALEFRINYIGILSSELKSTSSFNIKILHFLTKCYDVTFDMYEKRKKEKEIIENMLVSAKSIFRTNIVHTCIDCLNCLLLYNTECLNAIMLDLEKLQSMLKSMKKKRAGIFNFCKEKLQSAIDLNISEIETMKAIIATKAFIQAKEDSKYADSTDSIIQRGIEIRNKEMENIRNILENLKSETEETSSVVVSCHDHFKISGINRNEEITAVEEQINILEDEAPMLFLVYLSALETIIEENKKAINHSKYAKENLARIKFEIKEEKEKGIQFCLKLYCGILETLKIEKEAMKCDIDSLQKVEQESKYKIDTEGKEVVVSFKDLYLAAFDMKKTKLENEIRTQNVEENVKSKTIEIVESLLKEKYSDKGVINEKYSEITFEEFVKYYELKKEKRRSMIEQEIMDEFEAIEKMFGFGEGFNIVKYSEENIDDEDEMETKSRTPESFNRVYEVKMEEVEEDINYKNKKIIGAINMRKKMMESIVLMKKKDLVTDISVKEREMKDAIELVRGMESNVMCSLKDLYDEIIQLKSNSSDINIFQNIGEKFVPEKFQDLHLSVKLENFLDIALEIKEAEVQMIVASACKKVDKLVSFMKREIEEQLKNSKEKLREEIKQYRKVQKARVREYAMSGAIIQTQDYVIDENKLFPDISSFQCYVNSLHPAGLAGFFVPQSKRSYSTEDMTFHSEEFSKNCHVHVPFFQKSVSSIVPIDNYVLKLLELEINSLLKIIFEMNCNRAKAILHGLSFLCVETISYDASASRMNKGILLSIVSILNDTTSILMFGQPTYQNCELALKLDEDCSLVYFERVENIKKWKSLLDDVNEIAIDVGLNEFGKAGCLDKIATQFDQAVTTVPMGPSILERFIGDIGILQQINFAFLELHHRNHFCRNCNANFSLSFDHVLKILNCSLKNLANSVELFPLISGTISANDIIIAKHVSRIILQRGALLTAICLSSVLERIKKEKISIITSSFFIRESELYRRMLKIFVSYLNPGKKVDFVHCNQSDCGIGASMMAAYKNHINKETPGLYLLEMEQHLKNKNTFFSIQSFFKLLSDPELALEAEMLAKRFMIDMKFNLPLAVVWAHHFINGKIEEAENLCKEYCISFAKVSHIVCQKISFTKNLDLAKTYIEFLKIYGAEQSVQIHAYKVLFDLLFYNEMYQEAVSLVQECKDRKIPLSKLCRSTLAILHDFCLRESHTSGQVPKFSLSIEDFDTSSLDCDSEEEIDII